MRYEVLTIRGTEQRKKHYILDVISLADQTHPVVFHGTYLKRSDVLKEINKRIKG